jgi:hypothetical protein
VADLSIGRMEVVSANFAGLVQHSVLPSELKADPWLDRDSRGRHTRFGSRTFLVSSSKSIHRDA